MHNLRDWVAQLGQLSPQTVQLAALAAQAMRQFATQDRLDEVDEFGRDVGAIDTVRPVFDFLYDTYWRVEARGVAHVPEAGRALIVANHSGSLPYDAAMIHMAMYRNHPTHRMARFLLDDLVNYLPFVGTFINRMGGIRACRENAERLLAQEELVITFPEGVKGLGKLYRDRYQLARFGRGGVAQVALAANAPIIPCAVIGAEEIHPILWKARPLATLLGLPYIPFTPTFPWLGPLGLLPLPSRWVILFGQPIHITPPTDAANDRLHLHQQTEMVRTAVQKLVQQGLALRERMK